MRRRSRVVVAVLAVLVLLGAAVPAAATASGAGRVSGYRVDMEVGADGVVQVRERIDYAFDDEGHGIERYIPVRYRYDGERDRVIEIGEVTVSSRTGAPVDVLREDRGGYLYLRVGDPDTQVRGRQSYDIRYSVTGALNAFTEHGELYWNAIGDRWDTDVDAATVTVTAPEVLWAECYRGETGSTATCGTPAIDGGTARFGPVALLANEGLTVVVAMPVDAVAVPAPLLRQRWSAARAFSVTPVTLGLSLLAVAAGGSGVLLLARRRGRDERVRGQIGGAAPPVAGDAPGPVDWRALEGLRPGLVGTLVDERADVVDVTATIVDLAVRGHLRIEELSAARRSRPEDWLLVRLDRSGTDLLPYEQRLLADLFAAGDRVTLKALRSEFRESLRAVRGDLYDEVVRRGWYRRRPDHTRVFWYAAAAATVLLSAGVAVVLALFTSYGLLGVGLVVPALALLVAARQMPARTPKGSAALRQVLALKHYLHSAQLRQLEYEESQRVFSHLLPYAMVLGESSRWITEWRPVVATSGAATFVPYWYVGSHGWDADRFGSSLESFSDSAGSAMSAAAASGGSGSGGGSSGGGFGGGGGGGW